MLTGGRRICTQTKGRRWLTQRHNVVIFLWARHIYILKNLITFSFTSLEMRHYYQSPWDFWNDSKQSLKIVTFTLKIHIIVWVSSARVGVCVLFKQGPLVFRRHWSLITSTSSSFPVLQPQRAWTETSILNMI